jgi:hypothetical protein
MNKLPKIRKSINVIFLSLFFSVGVHTTFSGQRVAALIGLRAERGQFWAD